MLYKYDKKHLKFIKTNNFGVLTYKTNLIVFIIFAISFFSIGRISKPQNSNQYEKELLVINIQAEKNKFTREKFIDELKRLNIKFPHIVMAQSIIETGNWTSKIFRESNNLFGMKEAKSRINTANGTQNGHAYYDDWYQSIYDYAFYSCRYLGGINTEEEYFLYLSQNYAESQNYIQVLKEVIKKEHLEEIF
jgi:hypothetical protein